MHQNHRGSGSSSAAATATDTASASAAIARKEAPEKVQWSKEEEERLLRAALEIAREPVESFDPKVSPVERVRRAIGGDHTAKEIVRKTKQLRKRYERRCRRRHISRGEANAAVHGTIFEISDQIWGFSGGEKKKKEENGKEGERNGG